MSGLTDEQVQKLEEIGNDIDSHLESAIEDAAKNDILTKKLIDNLAFYGKTLKQWEDELVVIVTDDNITHERIQAAYVELIKKIQIASHFYTISNTTHVINQTGITMKKADVITALVSYYHANNSGKIPPQSILDKVADGYMKKLSNADTLSKVVRDFWKNKVDTLDKIKSLVSSLGIGLISEMKFSQGSD